MAKTCIDPGCNWPQFGGGYCTRHQYKRTDKKKKAISQFSKKRQIINLEYSREAREFREANQLCKINSPVCTRHTQGVHHVKGKATIDLLMDKNFWKPSCNPCNNYIEENSQWAFDNGHKILHNG